MIFWPRRTRSVSLSVSKVVIVLRFMSKQIISVPDSFSLATSDMMLPVWVEYVGLWHLALRIRQFPEFHRFNVEIVCLQRHDRHSQASNYGYHIVVNWANHWIEAQERISLLQSLPLSILILAVYVEYLDELFKLQVTLSAEHIDKVVQATAAVHYMGGHHLR